MKRIYLVPLLIFVGLVSALVALCISSTVLAIIAVIAFLGALVTVWTFLLE